LSPEEPETPPGKSFSAARKRPYRRAENRDRAQRAQRRGGNMQFQVHDNLLLDLVAVAETPPEEPETPPALT